MLIPVTKYARKLSGNGLVLAQLAGVGATLLALVAIEILRTWGWAIGHPAGWLFLAIATITILWGWRRGLAGGVLSVLYLLGISYDDGGQSMSATPTHVAATGILAATGVLLAEGLYRRKKSNDRHALTQGTAVAAQLNEERFRTALRATPITMFNQDCDLRYTWVYSSTGDISADEVLGKSDADFAGDPEDLARLQATKRWVLDTGACVHQETCTFLFGLKRCMNLTIEPLRERKGHITGITCAAVDVSDRNRTVESLREHELMLAKAQQIANLGSWEIQVESRTVIWSDQMYRIFGLRPGEFTPGIDSLLPHINAQDQHGFMVAVLHCVRNGQGFRRELGLVRPDGSTRTVLVQAERSASHAEQPTRIIGTVLDITERKRAEEQLQTLNETLEQRVIERTSVAEQRAMQLRQLASQLTLVEQRERRRLAQLLHDHLQQLLVGAKFGIGIARGQSQSEALLQSLAQVNEMLDQSIKVSRSLTVQLCPPILYDAGLAAALQWLVSWMHEKYDLTIDAAIDSAAEPKAEDIRILLFEAVRELLFNIVKHAGVHTAELVMGRLNEDRLRIVVADLGNGFDSSHIRIGHNNGSGFGLFSLRERMEMLGAQIEINSAPGRGTEVILLAPIRQAAEVPQLAAPAAL